MRVRTLLAGTALLLSACSDSPTDVAAGRPRITFRVSVSPEHMELGDTATIVATATNDSPYPVTVRDACGGLGIRAEGADGSLPLPANGFGEWCDVIFERRLMPGEQLTSETRWTHRTWSQPPLAFSFLRPQVVRFRPVLGELRPGGSVTSEGTAALLVTDTTTYGARGEVAIAARPARTAVAPGDTVTVTVTLRNVGTGRVTMRFLTGSPVRLQFTQGTREVSSLGATSLDGTTTLALEAGEERVLPFVWRASESTTGEPLARGSVLLRTTLGTLAPERRLEAPPVWIGVQ